VTILGEPLADTDLVVVETGADERLSSVAIGVAGGGGDLAFATKTIAEFLVGASNVLFERVSAAGFVEGEVTTRTGTVRVRCGLGLGLLQWLR
jgi:hypothetical protein